MTAPTRVKKEKNPNRVTAGKKLAEYNKSKKQKINNPKEKKEPTGESQSSSLSNNYWIYGGVGIVVVFLFYNSFKNGMNHERSKAPEQRVYRVAQEEPFDMQ